MKLLLFACVCAFASATTPQRIFYDLSRAEDYFNNFIQTYQKNYDASERQRRFAIFKDNLRSMNQLNSFNQSIYGINELADLGGSEFSCLKPEDGTQQQTCARVTDSQITGVTAPPTLDLRQSNLVTSVKDQGRCNSCWAFVSVGILEGVYKTKHRSLPNLSPKQLMDCFAVTCPTRSTMVKAFEYLIGTKGVMLDQDYPYVAETSRCKYKKSKAKAKVLSCSYYVLRNEEKLKEALVKYGPIGLGIDSIPLRFYKSGIVDVDACPANRPIHAVLLVGYGTESGKNYWLIKNSYGPNWGEQGYLRLARGRNVCGLNNPHASSATVA